MPLLEITQHGDFTRVGGSFARYDRKFINSEAGHAQLHHAFHNFPAPLSLHFINLPKPVNLDEHLKQSGLTTYNDLFDRFHVRIPPKREAVTVVLTNNEGTYKLPLTPWMVAHRIAHAISLSYNVEFAAANRDYYELITRLSRDTGREHYIIGRHMGTSRSFRKQRIVAYGEAIIEFAAQIYITGALRLRKYRELIAVLPPVAELIDPTPVDEEIERTRLAIKLLLTLQARTTVNHIYLL